MLKIEIQWFLFISVTFRYYYLTAQLQLVCGRLSVNVSPPFGKVRQYPKENVMAERHI